MIKVGVFFGGSSREREVSFAGGRTVYDNLDKNVFKAIPIFVDPFGNFAQLKWEFVYRGTIRDFYPPVSHLPESPNNFQIYADSLNLDKQRQLEMLSEVGDVIQPDKLVEMMDIAFLALHGDKGEDGTIQGLLEWYGIPYTGSPILASSLGMNKSIQKVWMDQAGFPGPKYQSILREKWLQTPDDIVASIEKTIGYPMVVKAANQGSSIGISILKEGDPKSLRNAIDQAFFTIKLTKDEWAKTDKIKWMREFTDIRSSIGFPVFIEEQLVFHPEEALKLITELLVNRSEIELKARNPETEVLVEKFIEGREFSCIVVRNQDGSVAALPPTEIVKQSGFFDYRSKYLPGLSRKITPIDLPDTEIELIRSLCSRLYKTFGFKVYARIDGFYTNNGDIFLNDPNTTSGMMPSSFFFHQASEIGLNPSRFLTYIIRTSLIERGQIQGLNAASNALLKQFDGEWKEQKQTTSRKIKVAVLMGGYSTERHISVESGRNIYEKLSSSAHYEPIPVFLTGNDLEHRLYLLPINVMLKDNADDISQKVAHFHQSNALKNIIADFSDLTHFYTNETPVFEPKEITYAGLTAVCDEVFIALHGRPGEDGEVQKRLEALGIPYNGSGQESSSLTIDKFSTNNFLRENGVLVADNLLVNSLEWNKDQKSLLAHIQSIGYPIIAKPADEGCSSAVKKLKTEADLISYANLTFRETLEMSLVQRSTLNLEEKEEFPKKNYFLVEKYIDRSGADHFLEITGGLLTHQTNNGIEYEVFEPSEALAEGEVLSLAEKFLAGEGQNITPARFSKNPNLNASISEQVRQELKKVAMLLNIEGYCRIDAFVRIFNPDKVEVIIIEINSLPGMTPATCIYHQAAISGYKPFEFIDKILTFGRQRLSSKTA